MRVASGAAARVKDRVRAVSGVAARGRRTASTQRACGRVAFEGVSISPLHQPVSISPLHQPVSAPQCLRESTDPRRAAAFAQGRAWEIVASFTAPPLFASSLRHHPFSLCHPSPCSTALGSSRARIFRIDRPGHRATAGLPAALRRVRRRHGCAAPFLARALDHAAVRRRVTRPPPLPPPWRVRASERQTPRVTSSGHRRGQVAVPGAHVEVACGMRGAGRGRWCGPVARPACTAGGAAVWSDVWRGDAAARRTVVYRTSEWANGCNTDK